MSEFRYGKNWYWLTTSCPICSYGSNIAARGVFTFASFVTVYEVGAAHLPPWNTACRIVPLLSWKKIRRSPFEPTTDASPVSERTEYLLFSAWISEGRLSPLNQPLHCGLTVQVIGRLPFCRRSAFVSCSYPDANTDAYRNGCYDGDE